MENSESIIQLHPDDNILVLLKRTEKGTIYNFDSKTIEVKSTLDISHKIALAHISQNDKIIKYGVVIGYATQDIHVGEHVHTHNIQSFYTKTHVLEQTNAGG